MRTPVTPLPAGMRSQHLTSMSVEVTVDGYETQPQDVASAVPKGRLPVIEGGRFVDDASQSTQRVMSLTLAKRPDWLNPGMWICATIGIRAVVPIIYRLPVMTIVDISEDLTRLGGAQITAHDPATVLNGRPYESDTTLVGTLRSLVAAACTTALSRTTDVSGVPAVTIPASTVAEFGAGSWQVCLDVADTLGYALRFTDAGDVVAINRNATPPAAQVVCERIIGEGGTVHHVRAPTSSRVLVTRGTGTIGLVGLAEWADVTTTPLPSWYRPYVVTDRQNGDPTSTQPQANALAQQLLRARLSELDTYDDMPILASPWLEAGADTVKFNGRDYHVRAVSLDLPSLSTTVTLRAVST